jgi:cytoskeletal protein CcmA (bactofilin family)
VWRNKEWQSNAPSASSGRTGENSSAPKASANSVSQTGASAQAGSWLSPSMRVKGAISGNEDLLVDGKVEGPISVGEHRLTVGREGHVTGGIGAREIVIHGKVEGNQTVVSESIEIKKDASMIGNVTTRRIVIEEGAAFKGSIEIQESGKKAEARQGETKEAEAKSDAAARALSKSAG